MTTGFILMTTLRVWGMVLSLIYSLILARFAGADTYAVVQLFMNFCLFASLFLTAGFESVTVRFGSQYWLSGNLNKIQNVYAQARKAIGIRTAIFTVGMIAAVAFRLDTPFTNSWLNGLYVIAGTVLIAFNAIHRDLLRATGRVAASMYSQNLARATIPVVVTGAIALVHAPLLTTDLNLIVFMAALICGFAFELILLRPLRLKLTGKPVDDGMGHHAYARGIFVGDIAHVGVYRLPALFIGAVFDLRLAALYFAAERIAAISQFVVEGVQLFASSHIAIAAASEDPDDLQDAVSMVSLLAFVTGVPLTVFLGVAGQMILGLFGPAFVSASPILLVLLAGYGMLSIFGPTPLFGMMTGLQKERAAMTYVALLIGIAGALIAISTQSILFAAYGTAASLLVLHLGMAVVMYAKFRVVTGPLSFRQKHILVIVGQIKSLLRMRSRSA